MNETNNNFKFKIHTASNLLAVRKRKNSKGFCMSVFFLDFCEVNKFLFSIKVYFNARDHEKCTHKQTFLLINSTKSLISNFKEKPNSKVYLPSIFTKLNCDFRFELQLKRKTEFPVKSQTKKNFHLNWRATISNCKTFDFNQTKKKKTQTIKISD